jgi:putative acetyltransferase
MTQKTSMRLAVDSDIDEIYSIYSHESVSPYLAFDPCSSTEFLPVFEDLQSGGELLVFENENKIVGVCKIIRREHRLKHSAYIGSLAIRANLQNQGFGRQIMTTILAQLEQEKFRRIEVLVACDNIMTVQFFISLGFTIEGTLRNYFSRAHSNELFDEHIMGLLIE